MGEKKAPVHRDRFFSASPEMVCAIDADGRIADANAAWEKGAGYAAEQLLSKSLIELTHADDAEAIRSALQRLREGAPGIAFEHRFRRADGGYRRFAWSMSPYADDGVSFAVVRDITAEGADLRRFKALADAAPDFIGMASLEGRILFLNPGGLALVGREGEDARSLRTSDLIPPEHVKRYKEEILPSAMRDGVVHWETELMDVDGTRIPVVRAVVVIRDENGAPESFATIAHDIRPQLRLEQTLRQSLEELSAPIIQVWDGVLALPVIGLVDSVRAGRMMDALLESIVQTDCELAVLDLTGVHTIDTATLDHVFKMVSAASLLGCRCVVSGISGEVAQTIAHLAIDFSRLQTFRSMREALRFALTRAAGVSARPLPNAS